VNDVLRSSGQPLDRSTREAMETQFQHDFSNVRIHTDQRAAESAQEIDASAYTVGPHIAFGQGKFLPDSADGRQLLAHELTHVIQQGSSQGPVPADLQIGDAGGAAERQAETFAQMPPEPAPNPSGIAGSAPLTLRKSPDEKKKDQPAAPKSPAATTKKAWSSDSLVIWLHSYNTGCSPQGVFGAWVEGTGSVQGFGSAGHRTCEGRLTAYQDEPEQFFLRYSPTVQAATYPHSLDPLEGIGVSALFEFTSVGGQHKVLFSGQDSAPAYDKEGGVLNAKLGGGAFMDKGYAMIVPIIFPDSGSLRVLLKMHYSGPPAVDVVFDDLIDVELQRPGPGTDTGIYLLVPDADNAPLVYKRLTGKEGWQKPPAVVVTVWSDDRGYYYNSKRGKVRLPERP